MICIKILLSSLGDVALWLQTATRHRRARRSALRGRGQMSGLNRTCDAGQTWNDRDSRALGFDAIRKTSCCLLLVSHRLERPLVDGSGYAIEWTAREGEARR